VVESLYRFINRGLAQARDANGRLRLYDSTPTAPAEPDAGSAKAQRRRLRRSDRSNHGE
jgi:hypothetical protein